MSTGFQRRYRSACHLWRVRINDTFVYEGRYSFPSDAVTAAFRKYLAGERRWIGSGGNGGAYEGLANHPTPNMLRPQGAHDPLGPLPVGHLESDASYRRRTGESNPTAREVDFEDHVIVVQLVERADVRRIDDRCPHGGLPTSCRRCATDAKIKARRPAR